MSTTTPKGIEYPDPDDYLADLQFYMAQLALTVDAALGSVTGVEDEWHLVGDTGEPAFVNGWTQGPAGEECRFRIDLVGNVHVIGRVTKGTDNTVVFTLPTGYRPPQLIRTQVLSSAGFDLCAVTIDANGDVTVNWDTGAGSQVNLMLPPFGTRPLP